MTQSAAVCAEHSSTINHRCQEAQPYQARVASPPPLAFRHIARPVQAVSGDMDRHRRTSLISVNQSHPLAADRNSDLLLVTVVQSGFAETGFAETRLAKTQFAESRFADTRFAES